MMATISEQSLQQCLEGLGKPQRLFWSRQAVCWPRTERVTSQVSPVSASPLFLQVPSTHLFHLAETSVGGHVATTFSTCSPQNFVGRDSSVGIATRYRLDGPGIKSRNRRDFPHLCRPALGPTQLPVQWVPGLFPGV